MRTVQFDSRSSRPQLRRGVPEHWEISRSHIRWSGRGGGRKIGFLASTTPSALDKVALRLFLRAHILPSSAEEGKALRNTWGILRSLLVVMFLVLPAITAFAQ